MRNIDAETNIKISDYLMNQIKEDPHKALNERGNGLLLEALSRQQPVTAQSIEGIAESFQRTNKKRN